MNRDARQTVLARENRGPKLLGVWCQEFAVSCVSPHPSTLNIILHSALSTLHFFKRFLLRLARTTRSSFEIKLTLFVGHDLMTEATAQVLLVRFAMPGSLFYFL